MATHRRTRGDQQMTPGSVPSDDGARDTIHVPVFARRITDLLRPAFDAVPDPVYVDATLGMGGHTLLMLAASPRLRVIGIDRDPAALQVAARRHHPDVPPGG